MWYIWLILSQNVQAEQFILEPQQSHIRQMNCSYTGNIMIQYNITSHPEPILIYMSYLTSCDSHDFWIAYNTTNAEGNLTLAATFAVICYVNTQYVTTYVWSEFRTECLNNDDVNWLWPILVLLGALLILGCISGVKRSSTSIAPQT